MKKILRKMKKSLKKFGSLIFLLFSINRNLNFNYIMNTNTLNKHLENRATKDITEMVKEITSIINKYDEKYYQTNNSWFKLQVSRIVDSKRQILFEDDIIKKNDIEHIIRYMFKDRYFKQILKARTEDLLNKVELLD